MGQSPENQQRELEVRELSAIQEVGDVNNPRGRFLLQRGLSRFTNSGAGRFGAAMVLAAMSIGAVLIDHASRASGAGPEAQTTTTVGQTPWDAVKYQTFPRDVMIDKDGNMQPVLHMIDIGSLGDDVDDVVSVDIPGDIQTNALVVGRPPAGQSTLETRVTLNRRKSVKYLQTQPVLSGDVWNILQISRFGGDTALDAAARNHAVNSLHDHQKGVYIGDVGLFEQQWGDVEQVLLRALIRAQRPGRVPGGKIEFPESNFTFPSIN